jgi:hypothetical protein
MHLRIISAKKKSFRRGREAFLVFCGRDWSQGPKRNVVTVAYNLQRPSDDSWPRARPKWLLLRGLLGRLLSSFLLSHGAVTSFQQTNVRTAKL